MQQTPEKSTQVLTQNKLFLGNGEMGQRIAEFPWEQTSLGPISSWPTSLVTSLN